MLVRHLAAAKAQRHFHLVPFAEEALHRLHLHVVVVIVDGRAHLHFLELDDLLLLARLGLLLLLLVFELAVVHQLDDRRICFGGNLDKIESALLRDGAGFVYAEGAEFVPVVSDKKNGAGADVFIDAGAVLGGSRTGHLGTSWGYDSLLLVCSRAIAFRGVPQATSAKRVSVHGRGGFSVCKGAGAVSASRKNRTGDCPSPIP